MKSSDFKILMTNSKNLKTLYGPARNWPKKTHLKPTLITGHQFALSSLDDPDTFPTPIFYESSSYTPPRSMSICPTVEINLGLEENIFSNDLLTIDKLSHLPSKLTFALLISDRF